MSLGGWLGRQRRLLLVQDLADHAGQRPSFARERLGDELRRAVGVELGAEVQTVGDVGGHHDHGRPATTFDALDVAEQVAAEFLVSNTPIRLSRYLQIQQHVTIVAAFQHLARILLIGRPIVVMSDRKQRVLDRGDHPVIVVNDQCLRFHGAFPVDC
jgi:hypothetical protein